MNIMNDKNSFNNKGYSTVLNYPDTTVFDAVLQSANKYPQNTAYDFFGKKVNYTVFIRQIEECAKALSRIGVKKGDRITICMPNTPHAVIMFYAVNKVGAIANMVHPLSSIGEISRFLQMSKSEIALTLDSFVYKFNDLPVRLVISAKIEDFLPKIKGIAYSVSNAFKNNRKPSPELNIISWKSFISSCKGVTLCTPEVSSNDTAAILYSGGTTGTSKGIELTNLNFNALALQTAAAGDCITAGCSMLAIMPIFHGFGLGVCIHTVLTAGCECILVPRFTVQSYAKLLKTYKPNFIAGVPTLFEALLRTKGTEALNLSCLKGVFCGGDSLSPELKEKVDDFLKSHGATVQIREGYGTTECVTASCLTPKDFYKKGSIGIPFPDTFYKIVKPDTDEELPLGEIGEIVLRGPSVMKGYLDSPEETALVLKPHSDGYTWLHTGDLGSMDKDGFIYFKQRLKRVIITSGYNVYPSQLESVIDSFPAVSMSCVIGVKDSYKMQRIKAFIMLKPEYTPTDELKAELIEHCKKGIAKYAFPYEFEFRKELPKTLVGKVAYKVLEDEENKKV